MIELVSVDVYMSQAPCVYISGYVNMVLGSRQMVTVSTEHI